MNYCLEPVSLFPDIHCLHGKLKCRAIQPRLFLLTFLLLVPIKDLISQDVVDFPVITENDLPEADLTGQRRFKGTSLFGYMDGGAELYLEYGFSEAVVNEIRIHDRNYKCEIFKMAGNEEAFGIFSVSKYRCLNFPSFTAYSCQTKYQLQFCRGPFYINIISRTGSQADSIEMLSLGKIIAGKLSPTDIDLSDYFSVADTLFTFQNVFMAKGRLGIVNGDPDLEDFFMTAKGYTAFILKLPGRTLISVYFLKPEDYSEFLNFHRWNSSILESGAQISGQNIIVRKMSENRLEIILNG